MKFLKFLFVAVVIIGGIGYGVYHFGTKIASDKVMEKVTAELESSGKLDEVKRLAMEDPQVRKLVEEGAAVDESSLPFTTKEQATRVLVQKIGIRELYAIQEQAKQGMSASEQQRLVEDIESKLTEEEIAALKFVLYKELNE